jgi:hypothetical protein
MLGHHWEKAEATIVARTVREWSAGGRPRHDFVLDVRPVSGPPLRVTIHDGPGDDFADPGVGDVLRVLYDPKNQHVKWDHSDPWLVDSAAAAAPFGTSPGGPGYGIAGAAGVQYLSGAAASEMLNNLFGPGGAEAIAALKARARAQAGPGAGHDPGERLARLQALQDRGLLTEAEYEAQRQRIISEI